MRGGDLEGEIVEGVEKEREKESEIKMEKEGIMCERGIVGERERRRETGKESE